MLLKVLAEGTDNRLPLGLDGLDLIWQIAAFLILVLLLRRYAYRPILNMLDQRSERIRESMANAEQIKKDLAEAQANAQQLLAEARQQSQVILNNAQKQANDNITASRDEAQKQGNALLERAQQQIQAETASARQQLRQEVASLALLVARRAVGERVGSDINVQNTLVDDALAQAEATATDNRRGA
jgi:F-type H+-transporting ATPase subunit b